MTDMIVMIMTKILKVLALATKQIKHGRFCKFLPRILRASTQYGIVKFAKKLLGESEVEAVLQRLDLLTQEEARMTVAQTLGVVHGLVNNMRVVMEGAQPFLLIDRWTLLSGCYVRRQGVDGQHSTAVG